MLKNIFNYIFKHKEYKESLKVMNELIGVKKEIEPILFFEIWFCNSERVISLRNYKKFWKQFDDNKGMYRITSNGARKGTNDSCYDLHIHFGYFIFNYVNFNWNKKRRYKNV